MKEKNLKLIMEMIFIFILPLLFMIPSFHILSNYLYDSNGNFVEEAPELDYDPIIYRSQYCNIIEDFNLWNENWEHGGIDTQGNLYNSSTILRTADFVPINAGGIYYIKAPDTFRSFCFYDSNYNFVSVRYQANQTFTAPNNASYIKFAINGETYGDNICLNYSVSWANGNYVPYGMDLILYTDTDVSGQNNLIHSVFSDFKSLVLNVLHISDNITISVLFDYTCLWFIMFIVWHLFYTFIDFIVHLVKIRKRE